MFKTVLALFLSVFLPLAVAQQPRGITPANYSGVVVDVSCVIRGVPIRVYGEVIVVSVKQRIQAITYSKGGKVVARSSMTIENTTLLGMSTDLLDATGGVVRTIPSGKPMEASEAIRVALGVSASELKECVSRKTK